MNQLRKGFGIVSQDLYFLFSILYSGENWEPEEERDLSGFWVFKIRVLKPIHWVSSPGSLNSPCPWILTSSWGRRENETLVFSFQGWFREANSSQVVSKSLFLFCISIVPFLTLLPCSFCLHRIPNYTTKKREERGMCDSVAMDTVGARGCEAFSNRAEFMIPQWL